MSTHVLCTCHAFLTSGMLNISIANVSINSILQNSICSVKLLDNFASGWFYQFLYKFCEYSWQVRTTHTQNKMYQTHANPYLIHKFSNDDTTVLHDQSPHLVNALAILTYLGSTEMWVALYWSVAINGCTIH